MAPDTDAPCRVLIGGFGRPAQRDLDFGHQLVSYMRELEWPSGVVIEDISYIAPFVVHRLQELRPAKFVLVGAVPRGGDDPGALRRYRPEVTAPAPEEVQQVLEESVGGMVDVDHTVAVARHWGALPPDTVVIEIEPADCSFGLGFSEDLAARFDAILAAVRDEAAAAEVASGTDAALELATTETIRRCRVNAGSVSVRDGESEGRGGVLGLVEYARRHQEARQLERRRGAPVVVDEFAPAGLEVAGRSRPWSIGIDGGGDWYDVLPLADGLVSMVMGDVPGRGVDATALKCDVRMALRAYATEHGESPSRVLRALDRLVAATGVGEMTTLVYLTIDSDTGQVRLTNAGHCPPLVLEASGAATFFEAGRSVPLGAVDDVERPEAVFTLPVGSTMVLFTDGLVEGRRRPLTEGLAQLRRAVANGPRALEAVCEHVLKVCVDGASRDDDVSLLAFRRL